MTSDEADRCGPPVAVLRSPWLRGTRMEYRHISRSAPDGTVAFIYRRKGENYQRHRVGIRRDNAWFTDKGRPIEGDCLWVAMVEG